MMRLATLLLFIAGAVFAQQPVIVHPAAFEPNRPLAPGSPAAAFGDFSGSVTEVAETVELPTELGGMRVEVDGEPAGLYAVTMMQVNFRVPPETAAPPLGRTADVEFFLDGQSLGVAPLALRDVSPAVFSINAASALRPGAVLNQDNTVNSSSAPASPGEIVQIFLTGRGSNDADDPTIFFRLVEGEVLFSGDAPGLPGLWQVNARIPADADLADGPQPMVVILDGLQSNTTTLWISP